MNILHHNNDPGKGFDNNALLQDGGEYSTITITITLPKIIKDDYMTSRDFMIYNMLKDVEQDKFLGSGILLVNSSKVFRRDGIPPDKAVLKPTLERSQLTQKVLQRNRRHHV